VRLFKRSSERDGDDRWIVVGLGNPGPKYEGNRHNLGAMVVDVLVRRGYGSLSRHKSGCLTAERTFGDERAVIARPTSYMNESGQQVGQLLRWYKADPTHLIVIHDELDIPFGDVRVKLGGGTAGHNGLRSVVRSIGTPDFLRVRAGVSRPRGHQDPADYVLSDFSAQERASLDDIIERAADATERILEVGAERAMNDFNTRA
jgi:peptidyl-tRNA hydrolase, PTH1 family